MNATLPTLPQLLALAQKYQASDLHLSADAPIMLRVDGVMHPLPTPAPDSETVKQWLTSVMSKTQLDEWQRQLELDFVVEVGELRFRANAFWQNHGAAAVFRRISSQVPSFGTLGLGQVFERIANLRQGLVLITGATGSGKSTTLAAMIDYINTHHARHIITIEDPIEFVHPCKKSLINQRQVHAHTMSFEAALRSALREDPDVILVGELRDLQTIRLALTAAETGHLVFGTLHTTSAAKSIDRIIDVFASDEKQMIRTMLSESLQAVVAQTLLPKIGGGRVAAFEIMLATSAIRNLIRENKIAQMQSAIVTGGNVGMTSLENSIRALLSAGQIDKQTADEHLVQQI